MNSLDLMDKLDRRKAVAVLIIILLISVPVIYIFTEYFYDYDLGSGTSKEKCMENITTELPVWSISTEEEFNRGSFSDVTLGSNEYIKLSENASGGRWESFTKLWPGESEYIYMDTDSEVSNGGIEVKVQTSDDNFSTVDETLVRELSGGLESFGICDLNKSRSARISVRLESDNPDKELTTLHGLWLYFKSERTNRNN
ncbi:MAG: hypothetical protein ACLFTY_04195 [Candidatus Aenigmatarchaeota archaeon]